MGDGVPSVLSCCFMTFFNYLWSINVFLLTLSRGGFCLDYLFLLMSYNTSLMLLLEKGALMYYNFFVYE